MARTLTNQELVDSISTHGAFKAIERFVDTGAITRADAAFYVAGMYSFFLRQILEAQNEVRRLQAVLTRMVTVCEQGRRAKTWEARDPIVTRLGQELVALDGWTISLYETDLTMFDFATPERGRDKAYEFADAYDALRQRRLSELNFKVKDATLFTVG